MIVANLRTNTYRGSRRLFRSYYPYACDRCGTSLNAAALRRGHTMEDCDRHLEWCRDNMPSLLLQAAENKALHALDRAIHTVRGKK